MLAIAATYDLEVDQMDVDTVFLNPTLKEEIYMQIPQFFELLYLDIDFRGKCLELLKSLYGLKQAPRDPEEAVIFALHDPHADILF